MKKYFRAMLMSFTMFCAIPSPFHKWDEEARPYMTLFLPLVGAFIGGLWGLAAFLGRHFGLPVLLGAALLTALPILLSGGMHMDGYMDVTDAVRSYRDLEERRRILKDPHTGSFATLFAVLLLLCEAGAFAAVRPEAPAFALVLIPVTSRALSGLFVTLLRPMSSSEYAGTYRQGVKKGHIVVFFLWLAAAAALGAVFLGRYVFVMLGVAVGYLWKLFGAVRSLDGMSGDIAGYALSFGEFTGVLLYALL